MLAVHHKKKPLDIIFCPMIDELPSDMSTAFAPFVPTVASTRKRQAAFTKEGIFQGEQRSILDTREPRQSDAADQADVRAVCGYLWAFRRGERPRVAAGLQAQSDYENKVMRAKGREILMQFGSEDRIGIVVLGRPYHNDPGINHEIMEEFQKIGYPAFTLGSLPIDKDILEKLLVRTLKSGLIKTPWT